MITAAIYARKSTDQNGVADDAKSFCLGADVLTGWEILYTPRIRQPTSVVSQKYLEQ
jgi:hypothetical protein